MTCVGTAGVGKTRLALQAAYDLQHVYTDGVLFIPLAPLSDPAHVLPAIAQHLNRPPTAEALAAYLRDKHILLVLDNFEQVVDAATSLAELLTTCSMLRVLVTSREALRIRGEHELPVAPLPPSVAVALFAQRARAIQPDFALGDTTAAAVAGICRRLDGLPLAIELAAAQIKLLPLPSLLNRLDQRLQVLTGGPRDLPSRHQTLRSAIAWSYELLTPREQRVFRRLGVFGGGCDLVAAGHVVPLEAEAGAGSLISKSLLLQAAQPDGTPRLCMLETIREYALEQLHRCGEAQAIQHVHASYYCGLAEYAEPHLIGDNAHLWLDQLDREHDNMRAALRWTLEQGSGELAQRLGGALWRFWFLRGYLSEGRRWLEAAIDLTGPVAPEIRVKALSAAGYLAATQSDYGRADLLCRAALELAQRLGDERSLALASFGLANSANWGRDYARARRLFESSLAVYRKLDDRWGIASTLAYLGNVLYFQAEYDEARPLFDEALAHFRAMGQTWGIGFALYGRGLVAINQSELQAAQRYLEESQLHLRQLGDRRGLVRATTGLAKIALEHNRYLEARALLLEAMQLTRDVGDRWSASVILDLMASLCARHNQLQRAVRLFGAADALRAALDVPLAPGLRDMHQRDLLLTREGVPCEEFAQLWSAGQRLTLEGATQLFAASPLGSATKRAPLGVLTAREIEVVRLVADGLTDAEIAERLVVSVRTVHAHLRSIYGKLDVSTRTGAARWGLENGLLAADGAQPGTAV